MERARTNVLDLIGAIKNEDSAGLKIGSYWSEYDGFVKKNSDYNYWTSVDELEQSLSYGKLYKAEQIIRKLLCRIFHYIKVKNPVSGKEYTIGTMKRRLDEEYREFYSKWIYEMSTLQCFDKQTIDQMLRQKINELLRIKSPTIVDIFFPISFLMNQVLLTKQINLRKMYILIQSGGVGLCLIPFMQ